jgi:uncharacterized protein (DUF58 family)
LFTKISLSFISIFATVLIISLLSTNMIYFYISLMPLFCLVVGLMLTQPKTVEFKRKENQKSCYVGENVKISFDVSIKGGFGIVILHDLIPYYFELVKGSNFKVIWKGLKPYRSTLTYEVQCTKRGTYIFQNIDWESRHVLGLKQTTVGKFTEAEIIDVKLPTPTLRRVRNIKTSTRCPLPLGAFSKIGLLTTDFREIREYSYGDPYRQINWKATARLANVTFNKPLVNEFEHEGKKFVWIFIDGALSMEAHGSATNNPFEYAIAAANSLSQYYLERDCYVGVYLYSKHPKPVILYPDLGRKQRFKISRQLMNADTAKEEALREAAIKVRPYLIGANPLCIVITTLSYGGCASVIAGVRELAKYSQKRDKRGENVFIINIASYPFAAKTLAGNLGASLLASDVLPIQRYLRKTGAIVVDWNPLEQPLTKVLLAEVSRR